MCWRSHNERRAHYQYKNLQKYIAIPNLSVYEIMYDMVLLKNIVMKMLLFEPMLIC